MIQLLAFFSSLLSTSIGIGGGCLLVPGLIYCSVEYKKAASTSLALIAIITLTGTISHFLTAKENISFSYIFCFIICCLIGTWTAKPFISLYKGRGAKIIFSIFILFVSIKLLGISNTVAFIFHAIKNMLPESPLLTIIPFAFIVGITATMLGVGGGLVIVPFFVIIHDIPIHAAVLMSLTSMTFLTLSATLVHKKAKNLDNCLLKKMLPKAIVGAIVGVLISNFMPEIILKKTFAITLMVISIHFIFVEFKNIKQNMKR